MSTSKKSRKSNCFAGKWSGVNEARTRDLLRDRYKSLPHSNQFMRFPIAFAGKPDRERYVLIQKCMTIVPYSCHGKSLGPVSLLPIGVNRLDNVVRSLSEVYAISRRLWIGRTLLTTSPKLKDW